MRSQAQSGSNKRRSQALTYAQSGSDAQSGSNIADAQSGSNKRRSQALTKWAERL
jgi:hypothetical protein